MSIGGTRKGKISLDVSVSEKSVLLESLCLCISLSTGDWAAFPTQNCFVQFKGDNYFQPRTSAIKFRRFLTEEFILYPRPSSSLRQLEQSVTISVSSQVALLASATVSLSTETICKELFELSYEKPLNVLLFGTQGSGKSTLINSLFSLLSPSLCWELALTGGASNAVTKELKRYRLGNTATAASTRYRVWDCWGFTPSEIFRCSYLHALLKDGSGVTTEHHYDEVDAFHGVVLCITYKAALMAHTAAKGYELATEYDITCLAKGMGIGVVVAVTKIDSSAVPDKIHAVRATLSRLLGIPTSFVIPVQAYVETVNKSRVIDLSLLDLLLHIRTIALGTESARASSMREKEKVVKLEKQLQKQLDAEQAALALRAERLAEEWSVFRKTADRKMYMLGVLPIFVMCVLSYCVYLLHRK